MKDLERTAEKVTYELEKQVILNELRDKQKCCFVSIDSDLIRYLWILKHNNIEYKLERDYTFTNIYIHCQSISAVFDYKGNQLVITKRRTVL